MPSVDFVVSTPISNSVRARQLQAIFDVPASKESRIHFKGSLPIEDRDWNVGLIVGPSGCGKSTILRHVFGGEKPLAFDAASVIDDFPKSMSVQDIAEACQAVGFNTIPAWLRPFRLLSNGEQFRASLARRLVDDDPVVVVDEFTSVVDRQVAKIGAHAAQKYVRKAGRKFVAASCHYDIIDWLQPDWTFEPATMTFQWRELRRRPELGCQLGRTPYHRWAIYAPFHYLTADLHRGARCFELTVEGRPAAFAGILTRPHPRATGVMGVSRLVTLPDFQGLGLAFALVDRLGALYKAIGKRLNTYPAHPALIRSFDRNRKWRMTKRPGDINVSTTGLAAGGGFGGRPNATFTYIGEPWPDREQARLVIG